MSKSDLLKDSIKGGLDGLLSPTKKTTGGKQPVAAPTEKKRRFIATSSSTKAFIPV